ncbi:MAG: response regulator [Lentisphaerae bacterium]|nr:response regulator [Lentisphaerota bacterium]
MPTPNKEKRSELSHEFKNVYVVLSVAFLLMTAINIYAYFTIIRMSGKYTTLSSAAIDIKLKATNANLLFREIISGYSDKDMNVVWERLNAAKTSCGGLAEIGQGGAIDGKLSAFKDKLLKFYTSLADKAGEPDRKKMKEEVDAAYDDLIGSIEKIEKSLYDMVEIKLLVFKILYSILIINILGIFGFVIFVIRRFISGRIAMENTLENSKNNLNTILNSINSVLIFVNSGEIIAQWNKSAEQYFSISSQKAVGKNIWELLPFLKPFHTEYEKTFQLQHSSELLRQKVNMGGNDRYVNVKMSYAPGINGIVVLLDDVTAHEVRDGQIRQAQKMQIVENMMGGLSNDFNNALGAITGTITMMKYSLETDGGSLDEIRNNMEVIESSAERAVVMVQQLLSVAQRHELCLGNVDLNGVVQHILKLCNNTIDKRISLVGEVHDVRAMTKADAALIEQVLLNLCDNAVHAMTVMRPVESQGGTLTVAIDKIYPDRNYRSLHPQALRHAYWIISVSDTGAGMNAETAAKIFDPFFTTKTGLRANGLGLTIANDIIRQHNGFIEVESRPDIGSRFHVYLPETAVAEEAGAEPRTEAHAEEQIPLGTGLILVADDELIMRKTAKGILSKLGYDVVFAEDGEQTVTVFNERHNEISAVLLDMAMPKMSGREAYIEMKKIHPELKVILISGFKKDKRIEEILGLGVNAFIQKPYSMVTLAQEVKKVIDG